MIKLNLFSDFRIDAIQGNMDIPFFQLFISCSYNNKKYKQLILNIPTREFSKFIDVVKMDSDLKRTE